MVQMCRSKKKACAREFDSSWLRTFPWAQPIVEDKKVIGVVCSVCREGDYNARLHSSIMHSGGVWVTKPYTNFGKFTEKARKHEFGCAGDFKTVKDPKKTRSEIVKGKFDKVPDTHHMKLYLAAQPKYPIMESLRANNAAALQLNKEAMVMLIAIVHQSILRPVFFC